MLQITASTEIDAPTNQVWGKLAKLDNVQHWVESVEKRDYSSDQTEGVGAERVCEVRGLGTLRERIVEWREGESFSYSVEGMPNIVRQGRSTWRVVAISPEKTGV